MTENAKSPVVPNVVPNVVLPETPKKKFQITKKHLAIAAAVTTVSLAAVVALRLNWDELKEAAEDAVENTVENVEDLVSDN